MTNFALVTMGRKASKNFTFSDGKTIPVGTTVAAPFHSVNSSTDGSMVSDLKRCVRKKAKGPNINSYSLGVGYIFFGLDVMHGRNDHLGAFIDLQCSDDRNHVKISPGRFFVVNRAQGHARTRSVELRYQDGGWTGTS